MATKTKQAKKEFNYSWVGTDKSGKIMKGEMKASSDTLVKVALRGRGITTTKITKQNALFQKKVKQKEIAVITRQLATMIRAGVPVLQSFEIVANGHTNPAVTKLLHEIKNKVEAGSSIAAAFASRADYFSPLYCNLVAAGEKAGILDSVMDRLATYQEKVTELKQKIKKAMMYPIAVFAVAFIVITIIMKWVIPSFKEVFSSFGADLPAPTLVVIAMSDFFVSHWYIIIFGLIGSIFGFFYLKKNNKKFQNTLDRFALRLPVFGSIIQKSAVAKWCRTLATMFSAGVPLVEALESVAGAAGNVVYYDATKNIQKNVAIGQSLTLAMLNESIFPGMVTQMAQIGEESGSLDSMLNKVADFYESEVDNAVSGLSTLLEPFIIVFLGVMVGGLVVAMYLPIFKMAGAV